MTTETEGGTTYTRLHISPLDTGLLPAVLGTSLLPKARNISYHEIATFPEKRYGFLELPNEDATKLRKKLNGAVLKGQKITVEQAKPERQPKPMGDAVLSEDMVPKKKEKKEKKESKLKKRKREAEEIPGVELEEGRKVKRGWTVADDPKSYKDKEKRKKDKQDKKDKKHSRESKSKYTEHPECLIKAVIPSKVVETDEVDDEGNKKRKRTKKKEVVVHEFAKTTKFPTFLKNATSAAKGSGEIEFVDGKGWVDADGNVVEPVKTRPAPSKVKAAAPRAKDDDKAQPKKQTREEPKEQEDSEDDEDDSDNAVGEAGKQSDDAEDAAPETEAKEEDTGLRFTDSASTQKAIPAPKPITTPTSILKKVAARPTSSSSAKGLSIMIPPATPGGGKVHPLEALYKRSRQPDGGPVQEAAPEAEPFSFFGNADEEEDISTSTLQVPLTPFSRQDVESRGIRSAAPTPDTAHPSRRANFWPPIGGEDIDEEDDDSDEHEGVSEVLDTVMRDDEEEDGVQAVGAEAGEGEQATSDFQKWFWEHRGDLNRSWKKRRKTAAKDKRYRENRARAERAI